MYTEAFMRGPVCLVFGVCCLFGLFGAGSVNAAELKILTSTFPVYQLTRIVTEGREGLSVAPLLPAHMGCPHDYALTPQDMRKLARADILVINGLGLEEFITPELLQANPGLRIVDASRHVEGTLAYADFETEEHDEADSPGHQAHEAEEPEAHHHHDHAHADHDHTGVNPHIFASPVMLGRMAVSVADQLGASDPDGQALYRERADTYASRLQTLSETLAGRADNLKNQTIMTQHGVFDYLARDLNLTIVGVVQAHAGQEPSAAQMLALIRQAGKAGGIFAEPQYPQDTGATIATEAGIPFAVLDPVATGPDNAPLGYFEDRMRDNMKTLEQTLGTR